MADHATSSDPAVQAQLDRLTSLSPGADILGLERIGRLLARLGDPHRALPPVLHVAGTNGKGSTCAFLRAALEAEGYRVHAFTSPHLVRFNERIRIAGRLISDADLAAYLARVLDIAAGIGPSFFEVTTAAAFLAFAETPADACVIEVGLGGRLDATNVLADPAVCGIAQLGIDHEAFLGSSAIGIAGEKAGIAKAGAPLVTMAYPADVAATVGRVAVAAGARWLPAGEHWTWAREDGAREDGAREDGGHIHYADESGDLLLPGPALPGPHQAGNYALAVAMLRHQRRIALSDAALIAAARRATWPARLQLLAPGPLTGPLGARPVWLDGGHNPAAGAAIASHFAGQRLHMIAGMLDNKDVAGFLAPLGDIVAHMHVVPVPGHGWHPAARFAEVLGEDRVTACADLPTAIGRIAQNAISYESVPVLIGGSLYLAGEALRLNDDLPE